MTTAVNQHKPVIGLMGGIGSGKSLVAKQLESLGCGVIDADRLAREALDQPDVQQQLAHWWGSRVTGPDGRVDRRALSKIVFEDPEALGQLECLVHPIVHQGRAALRERYQQDPGCVAIVEDCPLLLEKGIDKSCDAVVFVQAGESTRLSRVAKTRGWTAQELHRREKNQLGLDIKAQSADYIVSNDATEQDCLSQVRDVLTQILQQRP
jgi:dephospho-CoA kinase